MGQKECVRQCKKRKVFLMQYGCFIGLNNASKLYLRQKKKSFLTFAEEGVHLYLFEDTAEEVVLEVKVELGFFMQLFKVTADLLASESDTDMSDHNHEALDAA